ncbi:endonuclease III [Anaeroselena agilis]|uniref:Endonuclease III n=1 Tax=Anaeroselena agilis TaxID=3063788 RepID=A0ABU3NUM9_9FIRM|nr:endonuclease III [Selenomonadales bacterium 4137-cl]
MRINKATRDNILAALAATYGGATTALEYGSPFELLVAVVLSAQCTDTRVNIITSRLFPAYDTPAKMLGLGEEGLAELIRDCGLYRAKARNLIAACAMLLEDYGGEVPGNFDDLTRLPGVGRKTANVLLSQLFAVPAIAVDTHVFRVARRLGLATGKTPEQVEEGLMKVVPRHDWSDAHHWLIWHGRKICKARRPDCEGCPLKELCPSAFK